MGIDQSNSRRKFLREISLTAAALTAGTRIQALERPAAPWSILKRPGGYHLNDQVQLALIGAGGMGVQDTLTALQVPGVKLVAACDLYTGRLKEAKDRWGNDLMTTKSYKEVLARKDIDAVIIATPDHWHQQISVDALRAGKHVYCEKPMVHSVNEGPAVIRAQQDAGKVFEVGSQGVSSLGNEKARQLLLDGAIGQLNYAEGFWARRNPVDVWQYPVPTDASTATVDWDTYVSNTTKRSFDPLRFFRWRNYRDYGTGMAGDLFVHLFSSLHFITGSTGPEKIYASGGLRYWHDGREVPDVLLGVFDYPKTQAHPAFNLSLRCNFVDGTSGTTFLRLVGSEGAMDITWDSVTLMRNRGMSTDDPFLQQKLKETGAEMSGRKKIMPPETMTFEAEKGYLGGPYDHMQNFVNAIRKNGKVVEDAVFGYRAAAPALLCNDSFYQSSPIFWDPETMQVKKK